MSTGDKRIVRHTTGEEGRVFLQRMINLSKTMLSTNMNVIFLEHVVLFL
jgi:hypothetical protein